jgi:predicted RNA-binding protein with PIN domain
MSVWPPRCCCTRRGAGAMPDVYLFDGYNLLHAGSFADPRELVDTLASFVALKGARGVVVFDGVARDYQRGPLEVRYAEHADTLLESLAVARDAGDQVTLVTSDSTVAAAAGGGVAKLSSQVFIRDLERPSLQAETPRGLAGKLDEETRARLERLRRGE